MLELEMKDLKANLVLEEKIRKKIMENIGKREEKKNRKSLSLTVYNPDGTKTKQSSFYDSSHG